MERKHCGALTSESAEKMKNNPGLYLPGLTCKGCGATVTGTRDMNGHPLPLMHIIAGTRKPYTSGKGGNRKR